MLRELTVISKGRQGNLCRGCFAPKKTHAITDDPFNVRSIVNQRLLRFKNRILFVFGTDRQTYMMDFIIIYIKTCF